MLAKEKYDIRGREVAEHEAHFIPFSAYTRMSGVDIDGRRIRKGATDSVTEFVHDQGGASRGELTDITDRISRTGGTPLVVADGAARPGRHPSEGHRQGRHERALRSSFAPWAFAPS